MNRLGLSGLMMLTLCSPGCEEVTTQLLVMPAWPVGQVSTVKRYTIEMTPQAMRTLSTDDQLYCGVEGGCAVSAEQRAVLLAINFDRTRSDIGGLVAWRLTPMGQSPTESTVQQAKINVGSLLEDPENMANPYAFGDRLSVSFELGQVCAEGDTTKSTCLPCDADSGCAFDLTVEVCDGDGAVNVTWIGHYGVVEGDYPTKVCEADLALCESFANFVSARPSAEGESICGASGAYASPLPHYLDPAPDYPVVQAGSQ